MDVRAQVLIPSRMPRFIPLYARVPEDVVEREIER